MSSGKFWIDRDIFENPIWKEISVFRLFLYLFGNAVYGKEMTYKGVVVHRGQILRSYRQIQKDLEYIENKQIKTYSLHTIKDILDRLEKDGKIKTQGTQLGTLITIVNYEEYQGIGTRNRERSIAQTGNGEGTVREQSGNNKNKDNKEEEYVSITIDNSKVTNKYKNKSIFIKPTVEEIRKYCLERKNGLNAEQFYDFYESKGWKVGNQPMKDWQAAVRTWERNERNKTKQIDDWDYNIVD